LELDLEILWKLVDGKQKVCIGFLLFKKRKSEDFLKLYLYNLRLHACMAGQGTGSRKHRVVHDRKAWKMRTASLDLSGRPTLLLISEQLHAATFSHLILASSSSSFFS